MKGNVDNAKQAQAYGIQARNLKRMNDAGVRIVLGTDGNTPWEPHREMENMVVAGMTPMQVIVASTSRAAEFMRLTNQGGLRKAKARTSSCSTPIRWTTSRTRGESARFTTKVRR